MIGVGVYFASERSANKVPDETREVLARAARCVRDGAPLSAAAGYQKAVDQLTAANSNPVLVLDVLMRLGDSQEEGAQLARAFETFQIAEALCKQLQKRYGEPGLGKHAAAIATKHVVALSRQADIEERLPGGNSSRAAELLRAAQLTAVEHFRPMLQRGFTMQVLPCMSDRRSPALGSAAATPPAIPRPVLTVSDREAASAIAGAFFNLAHLLAGRAEAAEGSSRVSSAPLSAADSHDMVTAAFLAVVLVSAAGRSAAREAGLPALAAAVSRGGGVIAPIADGSGTCDTAASDFRGQLFTLPLGLPAAIADPGPGPRGAGWGHITATCRLSYGDMDAVASSVAESPFATADPSAFAGAAPGSVLAEAEMLHELTRGALKLWRTVGWRVGANPAERPLHEGDLHPHGGAGSERRSLPPLA